LIHIALTLVVVFLVGVQALLAIGSIMEPVGHERDSFICLSLKYLLRQFGVLSV
jgi:hypothetical protein